ncbi:MAG: putative hydroxymethylpyrimidine transport system permease protein [Solirubrobacterales bacterium]|jgi:ABC-type nitrate/sulfonate/bicarbonate transport system permease component|nr:putative hydroxymethylpyrimidine transport system permease protein [Solirubrobacterales bacterium]
MKRWLYPVALLGALIGLWQLAASSGFMAEVMNLPDFLVPSPAEIASALWDERTLLLENGWVTLQEIVLGFLLATVAGVTFAVAMHFSRTIRLAAYPLVVASQTIPIIVISPILVIWFGFGLTPKLLIIALICFFPVTVATVDGLRSVDPAAIKLMRTLDASRLQIFLRVEAPAALPTFFSGARIAVAVAPIGAVFAEWVGANEGLGRLIFIGTANYQVDLTFAAVVVLSAIAIALYALVALAERRVVTWR